MDSDSTLQKILMETAKMCAGLNTEEQARLLNQLTGRVSVPAVKPTYDPAISVAVIRAGVEAKHQLMESVDIGADAVERGFRRLARLNALLSTGAADPGMVELKEKYQRSLGQRIERYMSADMHVTHESLVIDARHQRW